METSEATQTADLSARQPAPGRLRVVQELINTLDVETGEDELADATTARAWLRERSLLQAGERLDDDGTRALLEVREALRELAGTNNGEPLDTEALATLERHAAASPLSVHVVGDGTELVAAVPGVQGAIGVVLAIVHDSMVEGSWARLKSCREHRCRWAFYDRSRNRSSTWCSMAVCGNRAKARAFRRRRH